ncbi:MAG TPA: hypothetical protein VFW65_24630 [Pseudonocardiaceae bacterium]|nr:hypothetical protein [Pseudonocardiaceae bacterium]
MVSTSRLGTKVGLLLPTRERTVTHEYDPTGLLTLARAAEQAGLDSLWVGDSLTARGPGPNP